MQADHYCNRDRQIKLAGAVTERRHSNEAVIDVIAKLRM